MRWWNFSLALKSTTVSSEKTKSWRGKREKSENNKNIIYFIFVVFCLSFRKESFWTHFIHLKWTKTHTKINTHESDLLLVCVKFIMKWIFNVLNHMQIWNKKTKKNVKFSNGMQNIDVVLKQHDHENKKTQKQTKINLFVGFEILKNWVSWFVIQRWEPLIFSFSYHQKSLFQFLFYFYSVTMRA